MNRRNCIIAFLLMLSCFLFMLSIAAYCENAPSITSTPTSSILGPGDRIVSSGAQVTALGATVLSRDVYCLGPNDLLAVNVQGHSVISYLAKPDVSQKEDPSLIRVSPNGSIYLPLLGSVDVLGKTVAQVESTVRDGLARYLKNFTVSIALIAPRPLFVSIGGEVSVSGVQTLGDIPTVSTLVLRSGVLPAGSVRRVQFIRGNQTQTLDLYRILVLGDIESDIELQPGDKVYVPPVKRSVDISGEVIRPGRYEMVTVSGSTKTFRIRDLLQLAIGTTASAALNKASVERIGPDGKRIAIAVDLTGEQVSPASDLALNSGDVLVIPSISAFQPIVRMIGEFKGDGVYQRVLPADTSGQQRVEVQNKSGIYFLKQGQTVGDVITATGGVTPQANLNNARIERWDGKKRTDIPVDLARLIVKGDKSADVQLANGDFLILPALEDKVHVLGEVRNPGSFAYSPSRRLIDYVGDAGGMTERSVLKDVRIVRGTTDAPQIMRVDLQDAISGKTKTGDPVLEAGDIVFVPSKVIGGWRDGLQLAFTALSMTSLLSGL
jgi:protein involved in polysaccharide export with SLBB domain